MSDVLTIARYDLRNARRSRILWGVVGIYVAFLALLFYGGSTAPDPEVRTTLFGATYLTAVLLPLVAIAGSYLAVAGERESNTVRFLLSQPVRRRSVVVGKLLSRGLMIAGALVLAVLAGAVVLLVFYPEPTLSPLVGFAGLTMLLVGAYSAIAVAVSAASSTRSRAIAGTIAFYFATDVFAVLQGVGLETLLRSVLADGLGLELTDAFYAFAVALLSPAESYINATLSLLGPEGVRVVRSLETTPYFLQPPAMVAVLVGWMVLALAVGVVAFSRTEIS